MAELAQSARAQGSISAINSTTPLGAADPNSAVSLVLGGKFDTARIQVSGTYAVSALSVQVSQDGVNWATLAGNQLTKQEGTASATIPAAAIGVWTVDVAAMANIRVTALGAITGTAVVTIIAGIGSNA